MNLQDNTQHAQTAANERAIRDAVISWRRSVMLLAIVGVAGQAFSTAVAWLLPLFSEYTLVGDNVSELAIGRHGYLQTTAFFTTGMGSLALALGIRRTTSGSWGSRVGSLLVGSFGIGAIVAAIFRPTG